MQYQCKYVCPYCAQASDLVWVHGISQCEFCHMSMDEDYALDRFAI